MVIATHVVYSSTEREKYPYLLATYWRIIKRSDLFNHEHEQALARERAKYMRNTREKRKVFMVLPRDSVPWSTMKEKQRNMNKCISPAALLRAVTKKKSVHREKWHLRTRASASSTTTDKTLFPKENKRGMGARRCLSPFDARNSQRGDPGCRARRKMQLEETVVALTRESSAIHRRQPWILMDLFSPRGAFGRNDADLHYAIYARIVSRYIHGCMLTKEDGESPFAASFFFSFYLFPYIFFIFASIHDPSRAI